ncbi:MAG: hypothetical protein IPP19_16225 [Verrucomicrobia bacterium]|nr:hypothetical protein [Verrucomicrobiota bacterium]
MKTKTLVSLVLLIASIVLAGCTTMADALEARGKGTKVTYLTSFEEIWKAMPDTVTAAGLKFVSANREDRSVLAQQPITVVTYGENVAIFVEKVDDSKCTVEVVAKKALATDIVASLEDWVKPVFRELDKKFKRE